MYFLIPSSQATPVLYMHDATSQKQLGLTYG